MPTPKALDWLAAADRQKGSPWHRIRLRKFASESSAYSVHQLSDIEPADEATIQL
jgi:hypothetical protein